MDWRKKMFGVHPLEASGPVVGSDAPQSGFDWRKRIFGVPLEVTGPVVWTYTPRFCGVHPHEAERDVPDQSSVDTSSVSSVDSDLDIRSEDSLSLQSFSCTEDSPVPTSPTSGRHVTPLVLHPSFVEPPSPPCPRPGHRVTEVAEAVPSHRLDSTGPEPEVQPEAAQDVEDDGRRQDWGVEEEVLEPASSIQVQEPPTADLPTTFCPPPSSQQEDTGLPAPSISTQGRSVKRLTTTINTVFSPLCFRSRRRVQVLVGEADPPHRLDLQGTTPESEPVPAAQRGRLRRFLGFFRRMVRKR